MRFVTYLALIIVSTAAAPKVARAFTREPVAVVDYSRTAAVTEAARSTSQLPCELSAERVRPGSRNRQGSK